MSVKSSVRVPRRKAAERGSVLALVPAGFLVLIILAAFAINSAVAYKASQQLHDTLLAAANDGAAAGLDGTLFYSTGALELSPSRVDQQVCASVRAQNTPGLQTQTIGVAVDGLWVEVTGSAIAQGLFARGIPGFGAIRVNSSATVVVASAPTSSAAPIIQPAVQVHC